MAIAVITTIIAGLTATKEKDIKKIVAISTLSQLGMIIMTTSIMIKYLTLLHTSTHAIFKALLFITIGRIIEKKEGSQKKSLLTAQESKMSILSIKAATLTLMRIPLTSRFFSKDLILEQIIQKRKITEIVIIMITAILTTSYSIKIIITIKSKKKRSERKERKAKKGE